MERMLLPPFRDEFGNISDMYLFRVAACTAEGYAAVDAPQAPGGPNFVLGSAGDGPLSHIRLPSVGRGDYVNFDWEKLKAKRPQRGGVPKGKSWTRVAAIHFANALMCRRQSMRTLYRMTMFMALDTIYRHARKPATRAEAKRLLAVLEVRR